MALGQNKILAKRHRVAVAEWTTRIDDHRTESPESLFAFLKISGYDGAELDITDRNSLTRFFPRESKAAIARKSRRAAENEGLEIFGSTHLVTDEDMRKLNWQPSLKDRIKLNQDLGGQYASFQLFLPPDYIGTGGSYREDETYLQESANKINTIRQMTWDLGLNFYVEAHIQRISEDPQAFCRILQLATSEVNLDLSHYLHRGITEGKHLDKIRELTGHTHVRMCRINGDLSANVKDPKADWFSRDPETGEYNGLTWTMFKYMKKGLAKGLSSRTIVGESGKAHLVKDSLTQDARLVPLYRAMANYADMQSQGTELNVDTPEDLLPWG